MKKSKLIKHYKNQEASFRLYFKKTMEKQGMEDIHKLRLSIKMLRTILSLIELANHGKWNKKEHFVVFSKLFDAAGQVREVQVNLNMIKKYKVKYLLPFAKYLRKTQGLLNNRLLTRLRTFELDLLDDLNKNLLLKINVLSDEVVFKESCSYSLNKIRKVLNLKNGLLDNRNLHKIRIHLKGVHEILRIIKKLNPNSEFNKMQNDIKSLNDHIGKWHDYIILLESLKSFLKKDMLKRDFNYLKNFVIRIEYQQENRENTIHNLINKYIGQSQLTLFENLL